MSKTTFDYETRHGLWSAHKQLCFYCRQNLPHSELHIEHIIPEKYADDPEGFTEIKKVYGLPDDFDLNDIRNLVPTHARCNLRKGDDDFDRSAAHYFLKVALKAKPEVEKEIASIRNQRNRGRLISKLGASLSAEMISIQDVEGIIKEAETVSWNTKKINLPISIEFIDNVFETVEIGADLSPLYDKQIIIGGSVEFGGLELVRSGDNGVEQITVHTLNEYQKAIENEYYAENTVTIGLSGIFEYLHSLIETVRKSSLPKISYLQSPAVDITVLDQISPRVLKELSSEADEGWAAEANLGKSIADLIAEGKVQVLYIQPGVRIVLEHGGMISEIIEVFKGDFTGEGREDIFVYVRQRANGGSYKGSFTAVLTKYSNKHLLDFAL